MQPWTVAGLGDGRCPHPLEWQCQGGEWQMGSGCCSSSLSPHCHCVPHGEAFHCWGGLQLAEAHCRLQLVGQGSKDLVELLVAFSLAALSPTAAPEQPQLELGAEDLQQFRSALETCREGKSVPWRRDEDLHLRDVPSSTATSEGKRANPIPILLTLQLHLSVGVVQTAVVGHHPCSFQVGHDHLHAIVRGLPGLRAVHQRVVPLQKSHQGHDVGKGGVGQRWPFCRERLREHHS